MQKNAVKTEVPINDIQIKIISAKEIARKTLEDPSQKRLNDELIAKISSEVENEQKAFDKATAEVEAENVKLSNLKDSLNSKILEGRPSEEIELENRKLEVQASLLINKQHEMNGAYKALMNAKDEIIQELIANK